MGNFKSRYLPWAELPQNIVGRIVSRQWKKKLQLLNDSAITGVEELEKRYGLKIYIVSDKSKKNDKYLKDLSGFSLGKYICLTDLNDIEEVKHESGHSLQSKELKWLYLLVVGICSAVFCNLWDRFFHQKWTYEKRIKWYYNRWPEKWADRLGGVDRELQVT